ncbi:MAG: nucleotidyltransferase domain-containing protein [Candidatus Lokiarchaeota archaeon]|nr:nucleotidyltransferase domain-containing protein [Candidatus Harpocratesius repetitus]
MTITEYLKELIIQQKIPDNFKKEMQNDREKYEGIINSIENLKTPTYYWGGSYGKKTMIRESYDMDLLLYFPSEEQKSLREIYFEVLKFIRGKEQSIIQKNVALRINKREGYHIDLVPAKRSSSNEDNAWIYRSKEDSPLKTNVKTHIKVIRDFRRRDLLKLMKLWKVRNNIDIPSFLIELISIEIIQDTYISIDEGLKKIFKFLETSIDTCRIEDPANSSNNIADVATSYEKKKCKDAASWALSQNLDIIEGWKEIFRQKSADFHSNYRNQNRNRKSRLSPDSPGTRFA